MGDQAIRPGQIRSRMLCAPRGRTARGAGARLQSAAPRRAQARVRSRGSLGLVGCASRHSTEKTDCRGRAAGRGLPAAARCLHACEDKQRAAARCGRAKCNRGKDQVGRAALYLPIKRRPAFDSSRSNHPPSARAALGPHIWDRPARRRRAQATGAGCCWPAEPFVSFAAAAATAVPTAAPDSESIDASGGATPAAAFVCCGGV